MKRNLSNVERDILTTCQLRAGLEIPKLAKLCKRPIHQVRYALSRLERDGIIRPLPALNFFALGWTNASVYFTTSALKPLTANGVVKKLQRTKKVTYVSCFSAEPQYEVSFAADSIYAVRAFVEELAESLPIAEKVVALRLEGALSGRKYLSNRANPGPAIVSRPLSERAEIDAIDRSLLHLLVVEPRASVARIAASAHIPETSARLRIKKLEEAKVISGYRYHFQNELLKILDFKVLIYTGSGSSSFRQRFESFADSHSNVVYRSTCIGPWEFELDVEVEYAHEAAALCEEIRGRFPNEVVRIQVLPRFYSHSFLHRMFDS